MQLNERILSSNSSYILRVLYTSFDAGRRAALHENFTRETYERDGALRLNVFTPCDFHPGTAPGWNEVETQVLDMYYVGMEELISRAYVPDHALLASRRDALFFPQQRPASAGSCQAHASGRHGEPRSARLKAWRARQQQQQQQAKRPAGVDPQIEMTHERGASEPQDVAERALEAAKTRAKLIHMECTNGHCHWRTRALLRTGRGMCTPARAVNQITMLSSQQRQIFASPPPVPSEAVIARKDHTSEHRDVDSAALCGAEGRPQRARAVRVVEMMLYSYESDILVMKLMEYGDLLHKLIVVEGRTDFNHRSRPLGLALIKHLPPLKQWLHVLDHGEVECYDNSSASDDMRSAHDFANGHHAAPWEHETLGRAAVFARLELLGLDDDDMIVISDADEVMSRHTVRVLAECHADVSGRLDGYGRLEMDNVKNYEINCCADAPWSLGTLDVISTTVVSWAFAREIGPAGLGRARLENIGTGTGPPFGTVLAFNLVRAGWHLPSAFQKPVQWLFKNRLRDAERKVRESVSPVSMDEYNRWLYDWPNRSAGAADAAKQVDRFGCCSPCCHAQRLAKVSAYSFVPRILQDEENVELFRRRHWEPAECPRARGACFISEALAMGARP